MANAKKLPSGSWRVLQFVGYDDEVKRKYKSFTAPTKREAEFLAAEYVAKKKRPAGRMTVGEAIDRYIESKDGVLSPTTVSGYRKIRRNYLPQLMPVQLDRLTEEEVQRAVNEDAKRLSAKTVISAHGLLTATLRMFVPDLILFRYICNTKCNTAALCKIDILQAQYLCNHTKFEFLQTFCCLAIDFLQTLCYNIIKEREGKPRVNPRERTEDKAMKNTMMRAWEIRKAAATVYGCKVSEISMSECLKMAWAEAKGIAPQSREDIIAELTKKYGRWTKKGFNGKVYDRIYFNATDLGMEVEYYRSGNVSSAAIDGERVSNCEARRIMSSKAYFDLTDNTLHMDSTMERHFGSKITAAVAALIA